jgi:TPR repeat protein
MCLGLMLSCFAPVPQARAEVGPGLRYFQAGQFAEAFQAWQQAAQSGDAQAAMFVGVLFDTGFGVNQDYTHALEWYQRAAAGGNATAMFNVAVMFDAGRGSPTNPAMAAHWYEQAAANGFGRAEYNLALMYEAGSGLTHDRRRAVQLYQAAASHGVSAARMHLIRLGQPYAGAVKRTEDLAMLHFQQAQQILLARGTSEAAQAVMLFRRAADEGNPLAAYDLGYCYEHGIGVPSDVSQAIGWYRRAAMHANDTDIRMIAEAGMHNLMRQVSHAQR